MKKLFTLAAAMMMVVAAVAKNPTGTPQTTLLPTMQVEGSFSMIMVPDPQTYLLSEKGRGHRTAPRLISPPPVP